MKKFVYVFAIGLLIFAFDATAMKAPEDVEQERLEQEAKERAIERELKASEEFVEDMRMLNLDVDGLPFSPDLLSAKDLLALAAANRARKKIRI